MVRCQSPHRTNGLDLAGVVWLPSVRGGRLIARSRHLGAPGSRGRVAGGDYPRPVGPEALSAGVRTVCHAAVTKSSTSSVSTRSASAREVHVSLYVLLTTLVLVGVRKCWRADVASIYARFIRRTNGDFTNEQALETIHKHVGELDPLLLRRPRRSWSPGRSRGR
jgi:hypothetical protein